LALLWYGSSFVIQQQLSIGQLLAFNGMGANVLAFLAGIAAVSQEFLRADVVLKRMSEVLSEPPEQQIHAGVHSVVLPNDADIVCEKISFHHPGRRELLDRFSLHIPGGITTAVIGESGCGKSTLMRLVAGIDQPQSGSILYGPYNGRDLEINNLRKQVVLVPQESVLFNRSICDNFRFAHPDASFEEIVEACRISLADEFIRDLPEGYQTVVGEFGANLSGGQRQRLAIARALLTRPPILILDESTSALDPVLENRLLDQLLSLRQGQTTLFISHRPSMILRADWIVYLEAGQVKVQNHPAQLRTNRHVSPFLVAS
jgi:ATP-binding cassette subfamily B protein